MNKATHRSNYSGEEVDSRLKLVEELNSAVSNLEDTINHHKQTLDDFMGELEDLNENKVGKVDGKGLSTNDFTDAHVNLINTHGEAILRLNNEKVNKEDGKGLSSNDFANEYKQILDNFTGRDGGITDLSSFMYSDEEGNINENAWNEYDEAVDSARETGLYKIRFYEHPDMWEDALILVYACKDQYGNEMIVQYKFADTDSYVDPVNLGEIYSLPKTRKYYFDQGLQKYKWTKWEQRFEDTEHKVSEISEFDIDDEKYPSIKAVIDYVEAQLYPIPKEVISTTLQPNTEYILGEQMELSLSFPETSNKGDVIYVTFESGETPTNLIIDTTYTSDIDIAIDSNTGYEIYGKFNGEIWVLDYSEYTVSEV